jgi:predicted short-subunit dehydrogenase-like oxidoreductase (DUF2520 family)
VLADFVLNAPKLAFAGAGRLGSSLAVAAQRAGYSVAAVSTRRPEHREWLKARLPAALIAGDAAEAAEAASLVFITASDSAVQAICESVSWRAGQAALHCSGALPLSALGHAMRAGAATGAIHPLQTFPRTDGHDRFRGVSFAIESGHHGLRDWLSEFAIVLGGQPFNISSEHRAAYHASAVMAAGLTAGLAALAADLWREMGVPRAAAVESLAPLLESTAASVRENGIPAAITGPFVRGDASTVAAHLDAMSRIAPATARAYAALALAHLPIAAEQGALPAAKLAAIRAILEDTLTRRGTPIPGETHDR